MKARLKKFFKGADEEALAVAVAMRNVFAHGTMGLTHSIKIDQAKTVRSFVLGLIEADLEAVTQALETQKPNLLPSRFEIEAQGK